MNTNCLAGLRCPVCKSYGPFYIWASAEFKVHDDGTEEYSDVEWDDSSGARCPCGFRETVKEFREGEKDGE